MIRSLFGRKGHHQEHEFRWRSAEPSRIEDLSDAVIGFAITLLVVSLEVPRTFDELLISIQGFAAFAISFALLIVIWYEHYKFFRRYGLQDTRVIVLNGLLLFLILFYVYPLKFLFTMSVYGWLGIDITGSLPMSDAGPAIRVEQLPWMFVLYGVGWTSVYTIFALFYRYALTMREAQALNRTEIYITRASMLENILAASIGVLSILLALTLPVDLLPLAGFVYLILFPANWVLIRWHRRRHMTRENQTAQPT